MIPITPKSFQMEVLLTMNFKNLSEKKHDFWILFFEILTNDQVKKKNQQRIIPKKTSKIKQHHKRALDFLIYYSDL
jgi:hypothetical protein